MARLSGTFARCISEIVYGPVESRRLGYSMGVNLFPGNFKVCCFNCVYCFIAKESSNGLSKYISVAEVIADLNKNRTKIKSEAAYLTFSGNGEPTLHPEFSKISKAVKDWMNDNAQRNEMAIFTNGRTLNDPEKIEGLLLFDKVFIKFEWGSDEDLQNIARPSKNVSLNELEKNIKNYIEQAKQRNLEQEVVIQAAIYNERNPNSWILWAEKIKNIDPPELHLYELDFQGKSFDPYSHYDFLSFQRTINDLLRETRIIKRFFYSGSFYINVDLCYSVDSLIYLPMYIADFAKYFKENGVKVNYYPSPDGDSGAARSIYDGSAQFALCDPQAAIQSLLDYSSFRRRGWQPVLVDVLIDKLALWTMSSFKGAKTPRLAMSNSDELITYKEGSTANFLAHWQLERLKLSDKIEVNECNPGSEINHLCHRSLNNPNNKCVLTADILGAMYCGFNGCKEHDFKVSSYLGTKIGKKFLFTGLLTGKNFLDKYPGTVNGVVRGLNKAVGEIKRGKLINDNREAIIDFFEKVYSAHSTSYLGDCDYRDRTLRAALGDTLDEIVKSDIFSPNGKLSLRALWNSLTMRKSFEKRKVSEDQSAINTERKSPYRSKLSFQIMFRWFDRRAISRFRKILFALTYPAIFIFQYNFSAYIAVTLLTLIVTGVLVFFTFKNPGNSPFMLYFLSIILLGVLSALVTPLFTSLAEKLRMKE